MRTPDLPLSLRPYNMERPLRLGLWNGAQGRIRAAARASKLDTYPRRVAIHVYQQAGFKLLRERQGKRGMLWVMALELPYPLAT